MLVGGEGNDQLLGLSGLDLLIGGTGADVLLGGARQDILIGGWTTYDDNNQALELLQREWSGSGNYKHRVAKLQNGTSPALAGNEIRLKKQATVFDDADVDTLLGGGDINWLLYDLVQDRARDKIRSESTN